MKNRILTVSLIGAGIFWLLLGVGPIWYYGTLAESGTFGDSFGAVNSLYSGLALAGVIYTIYIQQQDIHNQRKRDADDRAASLRQSREQYLTSRLNAASVLLQSYSIESQIPQVGRERFRSSILPIMVHRLQRKIDLLQCEAQFGFHHAADPRTVIKASLAFYYHKRLNELGYLLSMEIANRDLYRDAVSDAKMSISKVEEEYQWAVPTSEPASEVFEPARQLLDEIECGLAEHATTEFQLDESLAKLRTLLGILAKYLEQLQFVYNKGQR